ncbi:MAG: retention module-containing protein, partial [Aeromonas sp.]|uniref:retention module-containing protein n=1 Tax=Aeromonas sp. TaxID=647 RepID=UPI002FC6A9CC
MAELQIDKPTQITQLEGAVFVMDAEGSLRRAAVGMQLQPGERLLTESDGHFELADPAGEASTPEPLELAQLQQDPQQLDPELASLQEAIRQGADPTELFTETAAGNAAAGTAGGVVGSSAGGFVVVDLNNDFTVVEAGFDTDHQAHLQGDELLAEDQIDNRPPDFSLSPISLTEDAFTNQDNVVGRSDFVIRQRFDPLVADSLAFTDQIETLARLNGSGISSDGHVLTFEFDSDRLLTGYYLDENGQRVDVLQAELTASQINGDVQGSVTVTLHGPLDHQGSDQLSLGLSVIAKESDGNEIEADLSVSINDGVAPNLGIDAGISLQEGGASQSLDGQLPVNVGSDRLVSLNFEASQPGLDGLTSGGKSTTYQVNGNQITLLDAAGKVILTVTLDLDGKYHLQLDGVLDQPLTSNSVNLGLQVQGTDYDGDQSNLGTLNIAITDGALPSVDAVTLNLVEDSDWSAGQSLSGDLNITAGTDPLVNISFDASQPGLQGLTSGGQPVVISISGNSISGSVNGQNVFTLTLDQQGHYVFTLNQPLDQGSADSLLLAGFTLTDSDGDKVSSSLSVAIGDGANPVISAVT